MKTGRLAATVMLMAGAISTAEAQASTSDLALCQSTYTMLLMTPLECRTYLKQLKTAQARADHMAVLDLQEWHTELLIERSQACPCQTDPANLVRVRRVEGKLTFSAKH